MIYIEPDLTIATYLTLLRILVIPPVLAGLWIGNNVAIWIAFVLYSFACISDYFDGYIARRTFTVSKFGAFLDPIADKLLVASLILLLVASQSLSGIHILSGLIILLREIAISGLREYLANSKQSEMPVTGLAKYKTTLQMLALGFLMVSNLDPMPAWITMIFYDVHLIGLALIWLSALLTLYTGGQYFIHNFKRIDD